MRGISTVVKMHSWRKFCKYEKLVALIILVGGFIFSIFLITEKNTHPKANKIKSHHVKRSSPSLFLSGRAGGWLGSGAEWMPFPLRGSGLLLPWEGHCTARGPRVGGQWAAKVLQQADSDLRGRGRESPAWTGQVGTGNSVGTEPGSRSAVLNALLDTLIQRAR